MAAKKVQSAGVTAERMCAFWAARQGMGGGMAKTSAHDVLAKAGWARSVGGTNPYLLLRDRAGLGRAEVDRAVAALEIHELPAARGCTYVVPKCDFAIALRASLGRGEDPEITMAKKFLGVTDAELATLEAKVLDAVAREALDPAAIKEAVGDAVRALGAEGKKRGIGTTLPLALGRLQSLGEIRRVSTDGRLDQQRYRYARWAGPLGKTRLSDDAIALELARRFFRWAGPATAAQLGAFAGLGVKAARAAIDETGVVPMEEGSDRWLFADDRDALASFEVPRDPRVSFVSSLDSVLGLRRELAPHLSADDAAHPLIAPKKGQTGAPAELSYNAILDRGRLVGVWEWDGVKGELAWTTFAKAPKGAKEEAASLATYIAADLGGDARSFSLDSPESRVKRIDVLRAAK